MATDTLRTEALSAPMHSGRPAVVPSVSEVYEGHFKYVWRCLRSLGVPEDTVDDAVHDVFLVVHRKLSGFDGNAQLRTWLYAIALRIARRYRTRAAKDARKLVNDGSDDMESQGEYAAISDASSSPDSYSGERLDIARRALEALDDDKRDVFVLAFVEQMSAPEIAQITDCPVNTIYSRIRAARLAFSAQVERLERLGPRRSR